MIYSLCPTTHKVADEARIETTQRWEASRKHAFVDVDNEITESRLLRTLNFIQSRRFKVSVVIVGASGISQFPAKSTSSVWVKLHKSTSTVFLEHRNSLEFEDALLQVCDLVLTPTLCQNTDYFYSFFKTLVDHEVTVELKNDIQIRGTLKSVDQYLNIKLDDIQVVEDLKYPHLVSAACLWLLRQGWRRIRAWV